MQKRSIYISGVAASMAATMAVAVGYPGAAFGSGQRDSRHFSVIIRDSEGTVSPATFFSTPPTQNAQGSEDAPVYRGTNRVGLAETVFTITRSTSTDTVAMVECDIELPEGHLLFNGAVHMADVATGASVPVVGGTGSYAGASGTVIMVGSADGTTTNLTFDLAKS